MQVFVTSVGKWLADDSIPSKIVDVLNDGHLAVNLIANQKKLLKEFLATLREDLLLIVETDYDDPVYRDSYRNLYSTKLQSYPRYCVRLSFFEPFCSSVDEFLCQKTETIQEEGYYLGFLVVRPLYQCIGRNAIDVRAKKEPWRNVAICKATIKSTCIGHKLSVKAFPHASQDAEHMSCAENSIWALLEYFGNKYAIYDPILPSVIINTLKDYKIERALLTSGLTYDQISILLKKRGFETKIYSEGNPKFKELFTCYIESGLPLITCVEGDNFGHAFVCIGKSSDVNVQVDNYQEEEINQTKYNLCYWNRNVNKFVVNDDNFPTYKIIDFNNPAEGYVDVKNAKIKSFIVPLHDEIYLPAELAIDTTNALIGIFGVTNSCIRTFLTTSRSYKRYIVNNDSFSMENKQALLQLDMPKFVWVSEFFDEASAKYGLTQGVFLLDATSNTRSGLLLNNLIIAVHRGNGVKFDERQGKYITYNTNFPKQFNQFTGNLK